MQIAFGKLELHQKFKVEDSDMVFERVSDNAAAPMPYHGALITFNDPDEIVTAVDNGVSEFALKG